MRVTRPTLYDNDAALKLSAYKCWALLAETILYPPALLTVATFSLASQARKARRIADVDSFREELAKFLAACEVLEPSDDEIAMATELEEKAIAVGEEFDTGESQLVAVLINRLLPRLITGDKRALRALATIEVPGIEGKLWCIEQVLRMIVAGRDWETLRGHVCAEAKADTAVAIAFGCYSEPDQENILSGLDSYIREARAAAGKALDS